MQKGSAMTGIVCVGLCSLGLILFLLAATIVLSLIPLYISRTTNIVSCSSQCSTNCNQDCLRNYAKCNSIADPIKIITINDQSPFISQSGNDLPIGLDVDLINYISNLYNIQFTYEYTTFSNLIPIVQNNRNTISISSHTDTLPREQSVNFVQFFKTGSSFMVQSSSDLVINNLNDLCGKTVVLLPGTIHVNDVNTQNTKCDPNNQIKVTIVETFTEARDLITAGTVQVGLYDEAVLTYITSQPNSGLKVVGTPYDIQPYGILCNKNNPKLCCTLTNAINYLINQGTYETLLNKYSFSYKNNGICPSQINLNSTVSCLSTCQPSQTFCQNKLN